MSQATPIPIRKSPPHLSELEIAIGKLLCPLRRTADPKSDRYKKDHSKHIVAAVGNVVSKIVLGKHLRENALGVGQVLTRKSDDLLIAQVLVPISFQAASRRSLATANRYS
jgi:hypothetical protein